MDAGHARHLHRLDYPTARPNRDARVCVGEHEAVAERLHEAELAAPLARDRVREAVDRQHRGGVPLRVGEGGEVLQVAEQEGHVHGPREPALDRAGLGGRDRLLSELVLQPAAVDAHDQRVGERQQGLEGSAGRVERVAVLGPQPGNDIDPEQLQLRLGDPGEQPAVDAPGLDSDVRGPDGLELLQPDEHVRFLRCELGVVGIRQRQAERLDDRHHLHHLHSAPGLDVPCAHRSLGDPLQQDGIEDGTIVHDPG